jgi:hypothetical protein
MWKEMHRLNPRVNNITLGFKKGIGPKKFFDFLAKKKYCLNVDQHQKNSWRFAKLQWKGKVLTYTITCTCLVGYGTIFGLW